MSAASTPAPRRRLSRRKYREIRLTAVDARQPTLYVQDDDGGFVFRVGQSLVDGMGWRPGDRVFIRQIPPDVDGRYPGALLVEVRP